MSERCGVFPDPAQLPVQLLGPLLPACGREAGHVPPHRAEAEPVGGGELVTLEWHDPPHFVRVMRELEAEFGRDAIRMWVERAADTDEGLAAYVADPGALMRDYMQGPGRRRVVPPMPSGPMPSGPWLYPPVDWGPLPKPLISDLAEFQRVYGPAEDRRPLYDAVRDSFMQDTEAFEPVKPGTYLRDVSARPSITVDKYGGTYSIHLVPIPAGWRGWLVRARLAGRRFVLDPWMGMAAAMDGWYWRAEDGVFAVWRKLRRRRS